MSVSVLLTVSRPIIHRCKAGLAKDLCRNGLFVFGSSQSQWLCKTTKPQLPVALQNAKSFSTTQQLHSIEKSGLKQWIYRMSYKFDKWLESVSPFAKKYMDILRNGGAATWKDMKTYWNVNQRLRANPSATVSYKEEMIMYALKRDAIKVAPLAPLFMMPFGFFLLILPIYLVPRLVLPHSFWTQTQRKSFLLQAHQDRSLNYGIIIHHTNYHKINDPNPSTRYMLDNVCNTLTAGNVPTNSTLLPFKPLCKAMNSPFNIEEKMVKMLLQAFCKTIFVSPYQPRSWMHNRLRTHISLILRLDYKIRSNNLLPGLGSWDVENAGLMRGLNSANLSREANLYWLKNWIDLTKSCDPYDIWFLLHAMVFLSVNYNEVKFQRRVFG